MAATFCLPPRRKSVGGRSRLRLGIPAADSLEEDDHVFIRLLQGGLCIFPTLF